MKEQIQSAKSWLRKQPADASNIVLQGVLPLIEALNERIDELEAQVDADMDAVYEHLGVDDDFMTATEALVTNLSDLLAHVLFAGGYYRLDEKGAPTGDFSDGVPPEVQARITQANQDLVAWAQRLAEIKAAEDDEGEDNEDEDEDEPTPSEGSEAPTPVEVPSAPIEEPTAGEDA